MLMEPGQSNNDRVSYGMSGDVCSTLSILWDASPEVRSDISFSTSSTKGRYVPTCNTSKGRWYQRFATVCCVRVGDVVKHDGAYTICVVHKILEMYDGEYQDCWTKGLRSHYRTVFFYC